LEVASFNGKWKIILAILTFPLTEIKIIFTRLIYFLFNFFFFSNNLNNLLPFNQTGNFAKTRKIICSKLLKAQHLLAHLSDFFCEDLAEHDFTFISLGLWIGATLTNGTFIIIRRNGSRWAIL
jgi:hypothetical protein